MLAHFITRLAGGVGFRSQWATGAPTAHAVQDIADRLARVHDYLLGRVESLDDDQADEQVDEPEAMTEAMTEAA